VPRLDILNETIRNLYYHVPMWFAMLFIMTISFVQSILALSKNDLKNDTRACNAALIGVFFSIPGLLTGSLWAKYTWGTWWIQDPKLNGVALSILIYLAYFILRSSIDDELKKARISAVYNIFAFVMLNVFVMVLPRLTDSLHPGNGGNPAFGKYDEIDNNMRLVFYPAVAGWILFSYWLFEIKNRISVIKSKIDE
jgi:heme exporter protein C